MLNYIRDRAQSWIAWIIVSFIILTFALFGINNYLTGGREQPAAEVNGMPITTALVQTSLMREREQMRNYLGENFKPEYFSEERVRPRILQQLIERELIIGAAGDSGYRVGDMELYRQIRNIDAFKVGEDFSRKIYENTLRLQGMNSAYFEHELRRDLISQQYLDAISKSEFVTGQEQQQLQKLHDQRRTFKFFDIDYESYKDQIEVSEADIEQHYQDNSRSYQIPEKVAVDYIELSVAEIAKTITVDPQEVRSRYDSQIINYQKPQQRRARHILLTVAANADEATATETEQKLVALRSQIAAGEKFADIAMENSQDPGSAKEGGDLGFFERGIMDKTFEEAAFALQIGEVSEPVRSSFGYHLIKLEEVREGESKPFEEVKGAIESEMRTAEAGQIFYDRAELLTNLTYEQPDTLQPAADALELSIATSKPFTRLGDGEPLAAEQKIVTAAFSEDVMERNNNSEVIEIDQSRIVVLRLREHTPTSAQPLDEVRDRITRQLSNEKQKESAIAEVSALLQRLRDGEAISQIAQELAVELQLADAVTRSDDKIAPDALKEAFRMPQPLAGQVSLQQLSGPNRVTLIALESVTEGEAKEGSSDDGKTMVDELLGSTRQAISTVMVEELRAQGDISITQ